MAISVYLALLEVYVFMYIMPALLITVASRVGIFKGLAIWLIQYGIGEFGFLLNFVTGLFLTGELLYEPTDFEARLLMTYGPLALVTLYFQINYGVSAIRYIDPSWDEHRGPLYPEIWYSWFDLYDPKGDD